MRLISCLLALALCLASCATPPERRPSPAAPVYLPSETLGTSAWSALPGWDTADLAPGLNAFQRSCDVFSARDPDALLSRSAPWAGTARDWQGVCAGLARSGSGPSARAVAESLLVPLEVIDPQGQSRYTGYFEPTYPARRTRSAPFTEPVPAVPDDLVVIDGKPLQRLPGGRFQPYPTRADITAAGVDAIAWAHPADVFFLQIQGSGRLTFPDGSTLRAAYGANNGHPFVSTANWLIQRGWISRSDASMTGIRAWMDSAPAQRVREAMNANPRFVFFNAEPVGDPSLGPKGSLGVPLTPLGSLAVDPDFHASGAPLFVSTTAPGLGGDWSSLMVAQDTGGAIKGAVRGDVFFGTGDAAGRAAETLNAPGRMWLLLPRTLAQKLISDQARAALPGLDGFELQPMIPADRPRQLAALP